MFKIKLFSKLSALIKKSCEKNDEVSSTRVTSYIITSMIVIFCFYFIAAGSYIIWADCEGDLKNLIPNEMLIVFGSLLTHQLALLGINKTAETKQKKIIDDNTPTK